MNNDPVNYKKELDNMSLENLENAKDKYVNPRDLDRRVLDDPNYNKMINFKNMKNDLMDHNKGPKDQGGSGLGNQISDAAASKLVNLAGKSQGDSKDGKAKSKMPPKAIRDAEQMALTSAGVPKSISKALTQTEAGQKLLNKSLEKALMKNAGLPGKALAAAKKGKELLDKKTKTKDSLEDPSGGVNFKLDTKTLKMAGIGVLVVVCVAFFCCIFLGGSYAQSTFINLGLSDNIDAHIDEMDENMNKDYNDTEEIDPTPDDEVGYMGDIFIDSEDTELEMIAKRKNNEADDVKLEDFYSGIRQYTEEYDKDLVYKFFYKLYYIDKYYQKNYSVSLDMPLLMATLNMQSDDKGFVFATNVANYDLNAKEDNALFAIDYDWSSYKSNPLNSSHDIEVLAQHMVSKQAKESCVSSSGKETKTNILRDDEVNTRVLECAEGEEYKVSSVSGYQLDEEKYKEFLKQFLEEKNYINDREEPEGGNDYPAPGGDDDPTIPTPVGSNKYGQAISELAKTEAANVNVGGHKYRNAYGLQTHWCAMFVWWLSANTTIDGVSVYPDLVPFKSASTGDYMRKFMDSSKSNIHFYYNDQCSYYKGKNGSGVTYTPKPGDYVFVDNNPNVAWTRYNDVQDHTAIVIGYEDGVIYTVEGNMSGSSSNWINTSKVLRNTRSLSRCQVIGFGSWY